MTPINTATNTAGKAIRVAPRDGFDIATVIAPDGSTVYVGGDLGGTSGRWFIVAVSTATGAVGTTIIVHGLPSAMVVTPDGKIPYVLCNGEPKLGVPQDVIPVNTATNTAGPAVYPGLQPTAIVIANGRPPQRAPMSTTERYHASGEIRLTGAGSGSRRTGIRAAPKDRSGAVPRSEPPCCDVRLSVRFVSMALMRENARR